METYIKISQELCVSRLHKIDFVARAGLMIPSYTDHLDDTLRVRMFQSLDVRQECKSNEFGFGTINNPPCTFFSVPGDFAAAHLSLATFGFGVINNPTRLMKDPPFPLCLRSLRQTAYKSIDIFKFISVINCGHHWSQRQGILHRSIRFISLYNLFYIMSSTPRFECADVDPRPLSQPLHFAFSGRTHRIMEKEVED
jgi:hypothetical protein